tara:strand:+ start:1235 stop:1336 length:102 start_codon:yes stop_codon:yes gene_type:complete
MGGIMFIVGFLAGVGATMGMYVLCMDHIRKIIQ